MSKIVLRQKNSWFWYFLHCIFKRIVFSLFEKNKSLLGCQKNPFAWVSASLKTFQLRNPKNTPYSVASKVLSFKQLIDASASQGKWSIESLGSRLHGPKYFFGQKRLIKNYSKFTKPIKFGMKISPDITVTNLPPF